MIFYIVEFLASFIEDMVFILVASKFSKQRYNKTITLFLSILSALLMATTTMLLNVVSLYSLVNMLVLIIVFGLCNLIVNKFNNFKGFAIASVFGVFLAALDFLVLSIIEVWGENFGFTFQIITSYSKKRIAYILLMKTLLIISYIIFSFAIKRKKYFEKISIKNSFTIIFISLICFYCINYLVTAIIGSDVIMLKKSVIISWLALMAVIALTVTVIQLVFNNKQQKHQNEMISLQQKFVKQEYEQLSQEYQSKSKYYHDLKNHLLSIRLMLQNEQYDTVQDYINKLYEEVCNENYQVFTGSKLVDAVLNNELHKAKENNVELTINSEYNIINQKLAFDICVILSNLIDNAIEASANEKQEFRNVNIKIATKKGMLILEVDNYLSSSPFNKKGELVTNKKDKSLHGIGLKSVEQSITNNNGIFEQKYEKNTFKSIVLI